VKLSSSEQDRLDVQFESIKQHLGIDRSNEAIKKDINASFSTGLRNAMFDQDGICSGYSFRAMPDCYFLAQAFTSGREDLRQALAIGLKEFAMRPVTADDIYWQGHILCKVSALIQSTPFGVYELTPDQNRNVYLELGIAIGLRRPFILVKKEDAKLPSLILGLEFYPITSYLEMRHNLKDKLRSFLLDIGHPDSSLLPVPTSKRTAIIAHGGLDTLDFCFQIAKVLVEYDLTPIFFDDPTRKLSYYLKRENIKAQFISGSGKIHLSDTVKAIQTARLGIYRIDKSSNPDTFIALGIALGLNRIGLLVHRTGDDPPSDLKGLSALNFQNYSELDKIFQEQYDNLLKKYK